MFVIKGADIILKNLNNLATGLPDEAGNALEQEAEIEATESRRRTPVKTGNLRGTHEVQKAVRRGSNISVTIKVGGTAASYAVVVHEDLDAFHHVGRSKFLESTILESAPYMGQRVAKRIELNRLVT